MRRLLTKVMVPPSDSVLIHSVSSVSVKGACSFGGITMLSSVSLTPPSSAWTCCTFLCGAWGLCGPACPWAISPTGTRVAPARSKTVRTRIGTSGQLRQSARTVCGSKAYFCPRHSWLHLCIGLCACLRERQSPDWREFRSTQSHGKSFVAADCTAADVCRNWTHSSAAATLVVFTADMRVSPGCTGHASLLHGG